MYNAAPYGAEKTKGTQLDKTALLRPDYGNSRTLFRQSSICRIAASDGTPSW
jgi:hypothetical protein